MSVKIEEGSRCSFCGKAAKDVKRMIGSSTGACICDECIKLCSDILLSQAEVPQQEEENRLPTPREIKERLDEYIVGQEDAKKTLSVATSFGNST